MHSEFAVVQTMQYKQMNDTVREIMFGDAKAPIHIGEIITAYDNVGNFMNSVDYVVSNVG